VQNKESNNAKSVPKGGGEMEKRKSGKAEPGGWENFLKQLSVKARHVRHTASHAPPPPLRP